MPTFLDNSFSGLRRGYQQLYGQPAGRRARPSGQLFQPTPVAQNPAMGAPVGERDDGTYSYEEYYMPPANSPVESPVFPGTQNYPIGAGNPRVSDINPTWRGDAPVRAPGGQGLQYGGTTVVQNAPTLNESVNRLLQPGMRSVPTPTPQSDVVPRTTQPTNYPVPVPTPESDVVPIQPAVVAHPSVVHAAAAAAPVVRRAQPVNAQVNYWQGNPTMQQVGPQVQQGPSPNIFQRAWQSLGHLFGAPRTSGEPSATTAGGPGSQGHPFYGTPYAYGTPEYAHYWDTHWGAHVPRATLVTPTSHNPEQGQTLSGDDSSDGSGTGLLSRQNPPNWFQNFMKNLFGNASGEGQQGPTDMSQNPEVGQVLGTDSSLYMVGPPDPTTTQAPQYTGGVATDSASIDAANAANTSWGGGGGMSGGQMGSSAIGAIGSGLSNIGKNISSTKATYTAPNIPLPARVVFVPPTLAPNRDASY